MSLLDLQNLNGNNGWLIPGKISDEQIGQKVYSAGDINGDGLDDLIVTATNGGRPNTDPVGFVSTDLRGQAYVIFGSRDRFTDGSEANRQEARFDLEELNGSNGFSISGLEESHELGNAVAVGDINGDGIDDLALGAALAGNNITDFGFTFSDNKGEVYVIFGQRNGFASEFDLRSLNGSNGFKLQGIDEQDLFGTAISSAGDINGDGIDDLAISAAGGGQLVTNDFGFTSSDRSGEVAVLFGKRDGWESGVNIALLNGSDGFVVEGKDVDDNLGDSLSIAGDLNGDGIDDLLIGAPTAGEVLDSPFANGDSDRRGEVYILWGRRNGFDSRFKITQQLNSGNGLAISGKGIEDHLGISLSSAGDFNNDGIDDLILSASQASISGEFSQEGEVYVIFGKRDGLGTELALENLNGSNGFTISGLDPYDNLGDAVSVGDFNGDGIDDLIVGANFAGETVNRSGVDYSDRRGAAYVIFGQQSGFEQQIDLNNLTANTGLTIMGLNSEDNLGDAVSSGGDLNGDGTDDLIVTAPRADLAGYDSDTGAVYVVFGIPQVTTPQVIQGTPFQDELIGGSNDDRLLGQQGRDTLIGNDGNDLLNGGSDRDSLVGGNGFDTLLGGDNGDTLWGGADDDLLQGQANQDQLNGEAGNDNLLGGGDNDRLFGGSGDDTLNGTNLDNFEASVYEQDTLIGGAGADLFILGDRQQVYYDDRNPNDAGGSSYGFIEDFNPQQDRIQLQGRAQDYQLGFYANGAGGMGANLFYLGDNIVPERIGIFASLDTQVTLNDTAFSYVAKISNNQPEQILGQTTVYNDEIIGSFNDDRILGQQGRDTLIGNDGNDLLNGGSDRDSLIGGNGFDTLLGGDNGDTLDGGADNDLLQGQANQDRLNGEVGNDTLLGGGDNDRLFGGSGDDTLNGTNPNNFEASVYEQDTLIGGAGADLFILGDRQQVYYDDRNPHDAGGSSYGFIEDFNPQQDRIQLQGRAQDYQLGFYANGAGGMGANLFYLGDNTVPERIGIFASLDTQITLNDDAFSYI